MRYRHENSLQAASGLRDWRTQLNLAVFTAEQDTADFFLCTDHQWHSFTTPEQTHMVWALGWDCTFYSVEYPNSCFEQTYLDCRTGSECLDASFRDAVPFKLWDTTWCGLLLLQNFWPLLNMPFPMGRGCPHMEVHRAGKERAACKILLLK
jgi:hypothetical protein